MSREGKTRRRLVYLLTGTLAISALGGGAALYRLHYIKQRALQGRTDGLAAMDRHDYATALVELGKYLSRYPNDVEILLPYAKARGLVPETDGRQVGQAVGLFQRVMELSPGQPEAQSSLLELYPLVGYNTETIGIADAILAKSPGDTRALVAKIKALMRMQRMDQAETNAQILTTVAPLDLTFQILELEIMLKLGKQNQMEDYAARLAKAHPNDVRFQLLQSIAARYVGDSKSAVALVRPLLNQPSPDAAYDRFLIGQLDKLGLSDESFTALQRAAKANPDRELTQQLISRLFETNRLAQVVEQTDGLDPAAAGSDVEILGMRILALVHLDRRPEADKVLAALDARRGRDVSVSHWAAVLHALTQPESGDPVERIGLLREALAGSPNNPLLLEELGNAYAEAGAHDKALAAWTLVAQIAPVWSTPLVRISQMLGSSGNPAGGLAAAKAAQLRAPQDRDVLMCLVYATAANLSGDPTDSATLLAQIDELKRRFPNDYDVQVLQAEVLAQTRQNDASIRVIRAVLAANPVAPEKSLLALARLSEAFKLDQEEACFSLSEKEHGATVAVVYARAAWLFNHQRGPEGLKLVEQARAAHPGDDAVWRKMSAAFLDLTGDARAKTEWISLADDHPKDVGIQWSALSARAAQDDHDFLGKTIDRLIALLGDDSMTLRLLRARWLMQGQPSDKDITEAAIKLSEITRSAPDMYAPHLLLATCYIRMGNVTGAIEQFTKVLESQPEQAGVAIELAQLLQAHGDFTGARKYIDLATHSKFATVQNMRQAASLLAQQGDYTTALSLLEKTYASVDKPPPDLVLAALYRQLNQLQKTDEICRQLLEKPDAAIISFCADFYASQGRMPEAQHALSLLDTLKLRPGGKELILGDFATHHGSFDDALKNFQAAVQAAPDEVVVRKQLVVYCLSAGRIDEALAAADQAIQRNVGKTDFEVLQHNAALVRDAAKIPGTRQLLVMLTTASPSNAPVLDALRIVVDAPRQNQAPRTTAAKLRTLADQNSRILPLQTITIQFYMDAKQIDEAVSMATHAVQSFPAAVEPLRLATGVLEKAQQWEQLKGTATEWRRLGSGENMDADVAIAAAEIHMGDPATASQQIEPYFARAADDPEKFSAVVLLHAQAFLASHQPAAAENLLGPLLVKSQEWRAFWLRLAVQSVEDQARAQAWLEQVTPLVAADLNEKTTLAEAWMAAGQRWANRDFDLKGRKILAEVLQSPDAPVKALLASGTLCENAQPPDWAGAQNVYRQALVKDPASAIGLNNLAYALVKGGGDLEEAQRLIDQDLKLFPNVAAFLDTKATVQAARSDYEGAVATLRQAQALEPGNIEWNINLLSVLIDSKKIPDARTESQHISTVIAASPNMISPQLRKRYETLRKQLQ